MLNMAMHTRATVQKQLPKMLVQPVKNIMSEKAWIWWTFSRTEFQLWLPWKHWDAEDALFQGSFVQGVCSVPGSSQPLQPFPGHGLQFDSSVSGWVRLLLSGINTGSYPAQIFELSFFSSNAHLCHMPAVPDFGFLIPRGGCLLFALTKQQRELRQAHLKSSNPSQKKVYSECTSGHCITVCYQTHRCSPVTLWDGARLSLLSSSFPLIFPAPWPLLHEGEKLQHS